MRVLEYTFKRLTDYELYNRYNDYKYHYGRDDATEATMKVEVSGKQFYAKSVDQFIPEYVVRRKLEEFILREISKELFGK